MSEPMCYGEETAIPEDVIRQAHFYARDSHVCRCGKWSRERDPVTGLWKQGTPISSRPLGAFFL